ncbi:Metallo-dependent phosphatase [Lepidopterella palustris CBS 459.81]|uniref:Metallo-dependent phosphatase n=1 Tax=Lepidopterella palustris CBS 459.81 TaxID=1314670 RepID=A0A8E2EFK8_9PEZI|nr:Metallo-dependent phosphatase [Lepidopterella palustris CBS 459.81]
MFFTAQKISCFREPTPFEQFLWSPLRYSTRRLYRLLSAYRLPPKPAEPPIRIICISDTHNGTPPIPGGDLIIHAGDLSNSGTLSEIQAQIDWLAALPHLHKIAIAGNHDTYLDPSSRPTLAPADRTGELNWKDVIYLQSDSAVLHFPSHNNRTLKIYGAPHVPLCGGSNFAFQYPRHMDSWTDTIPPDVDVLVTHSPPRCYRDQPRGVPSGVGCAGLLRALWRVKPRLHVFGHVHAGRGREVLGWERGQAAFERACRRRNGGLWELLSFPAWVDLVSVVLSEILGIVGDRLGRGRRMRSMLVNAAMLYDRSGCPENGVHVILI